MSVPRPDNTERGAALITVLVMLAMMALLAALIVDAAAVGARRAANQNQMAQTRWYMLGAEAFAIGRLEAMRGSRDEPQPPGATWQGLPNTFPLDDGAMTVTLWDGGNCFNLNAVYSRRDEARRGEEDDVNGRVQFERLLELLNLSSEASVLVPSLRDWIDTDLSPTSGGAEDAAYARGDTPYLTGNTRLADTSELRHVRGFTPEVIERLAPYVCVRSGARALQLNPNNLTVEQAPLLAAALGPDVSLSTARNIIARRPPLGWRELDDFFNDPRFLGASIDRTARRQFSLRTDQFVMGVRVAHRDVVESGAALIEMRGRARVVRRVFGAGAERRIL